MKSGGVNVGNSGAGCVKRTGCEKRFRSISNRISFPSGEIIELSADINKKSWCKASGRTGTCRKEHGRLRMTEES